MSMLVQEVTTNCKDNFNFDILIQIFICSLMPKLDEENCSVSTSQMKISDKVQYEEEVKPMSEEGPILLSSSAVQNSVMTELYKKLVSLVETNCIR